MSHPRAPTDSWNMWFRPHITPLFDRLIENFVVKHRVNPDKVYVLGYSAGGDGVYQIGPRMADRWAAASMMAGHPNDAKPDNLRNIGFGLFMGGNDSSYNRNGMAKTWKGLLAGLKKRFRWVRSTVRIYPGLGHWMNLRDAEALPWMAKFTRDPCRRRSSGGRTESPRPAFIGWASQRVTMLKDAESRRLSGAKRST